MKLFSSKKNSVAEDTDALVELNTSAEPNDLPPGLSSLYSPQITATAHVRDILDVLLETNKIDTKQFDQLRQDEQNKPNTDVEKLARNLGLSDSDILAAKANLYGFEFRKLQTEDVDKDAFAKLALKYIKSNLVMPIAVNDNTLLVATSKPADVFTIDDVKRQTQMHVEVVVCTKRDIEEICEELDDNKLDFNVDEFMNEMDDIEVVKDIEEDIADLERSAAESPVIKFVNFLLSNALREGASDIHIEPKEKQTKIRYRIDGMLFDMQQTNPKMHPAIVSRIKIMSNLDISERRLPQDGKIAVKMSGRNIDLRVSVLPTSFGEKVVIRILDSSSIMRGLENSGMEPRLIEQFREQIAMPHGILLVTGPTGSGKSTTLYSALGEMNSQHLNISTVEDPVEYNLEFCNQIQVKEHIGMTFAAALRSLLRQDPDIIMIGEIRDRETSKIAVQAALTGHLVLSTLHTNDAPSSISRLVNIGIEPYLIAASLNGILAQRLVRRICENCIEPYKVPDNMQKFIESTGVDPKKVMHGKGCDKCRDSGYIGRAGIFEMLIVDDRFRNIINKDASVSPMKKAFKESGQSSLFEDGIEKVKQGITTIEEVLRVTEAFGYEDIEMPSVIVEDSDSDQKKKKTKSSAKGKSVKGIIL